MWTRYWLCRGLYANVIAELELPVVIIIIFEWEKPTSLICWSGPPFIKLLHVIITCNNISIMLLNTNVCCIEVVSDPLDPGL